MRELVAEVRPTTSRKYLSDEFILPMLSSLLAAVVERFRGCGPRGKASSSRAFNRSVAPPSVETLEDRCLPSATTTVPALSDLPSSLGLANTIMVLQPRGDPTVVFLGDSINNGFAYGPGMPLWAAIMAPAGMTDYAIDGQTTQSLLYQLSLGQLVGVHPSAVVLEIGANNLLQGDTPQATAAGILADVIMIHQYLPQTQVLVLGVLPGGATSDDPYRIAGAQTDTLVSQLLVGDSLATFVDTSSLFLQPDGTISNTVLSDYIHPTLLGYLDLTTALLPSIQQAVFSNATAAPATSLFSS
jgi:lysophospholipase L1-like esterase